MQTQLVRVLIALASFFILAASAQAASLSQVFKKVSGAVVVVEVQEFKEDGQAPDESVGSGTLISMQGLVLTASHVVQTADRIMIRFNDGRQARAEVVASEPAADIALLRIARVPEGIKPVPLGDSNAMQVGDEVFVVGAPYGLGPTLTAGHLSSRHAPDGQARGVGLAELIQTDAAVNTGNSGGPLFNLEGKVIGVVSHILSRSGGFEGVSFAVTSQTVRKLLLERGAFWSGLDGIVIGGRLAKALNIPHPAGYLVTRVAKGSPGHQLGLQAGELKIRYKGKPMTIGGDIILEVQGMHIYEEGSYKKISEHLARLEAGDQLKVLVLRAGKQVQLSAQLRPCRLCSASESVSGDFVSPKLMPGFLEVPVSGSK